MFYCVLAYNWPNVKLIAHSDRKLWIFKLWKLDVWKTPFCKSGHKFCYVPCWCYFCGLKIYKHSSVHENIDILYRFYTKNSGVLFENDVIQIGVKSECKETLGQSLEKNNSV